MVDLRVGVVADRSHETRSNRVVSAARKGIERAESRAMVISPKSLNGSWQTGVRSQMMKTIFGHTAPRNSAYRLE